MAGKYTTSMRSLWPFAPLAVLYLLSIHAYYVGFFNDDAFYLIGARALAHGRYVQLNEPGEPPLIQYTPGYPLLLAPLMRLGGSFLACQLLSITMTLAALWFLKRYFGQEPNREAGLAAWLLMALNPLTVSLSGTVLSDVPYLLATSALLVMIRDRWEDPLNRWLAPACLIAFACYVRPAGAALTLALALALALERRLRTASICLAIPALAILPYLVRNLLASGDPLPYVSEFAAPYHGRLLSALSANAARNSAYYLREFFARTMFRLGGPDAAANVTEALGLAVLALGLSQGDGGFENFVRLYLAFYAAIHLSWAKQSGRYLVPVLPLGLAYFFRGMAALQRRWPKLPLCRGACALSLLLCLRPLAGILQASLFLKRTPINTPPERTFAWIREHTNPSDVFAAELDARLYLHTGRRTVRLPKAKDARAFAQWLKARGVGYVLVFPDDFIMRTASGTSSHDPLPLPELKLLLARLKARETFHDPDEGSAIYRVP